MIFRRPVKENAISRSAKSIIGGGSSAHSGESRFDQPFSDETDAISLSLKRMHTEFNLIITRTSFPDEVSWYSVIHCRDIDTEEK